MKFVTLTENRGYSNERHLVRITSGAFTVMNFLVWGHGEECIDQVVDYLAEHAPGLLDTDYVNEEMERLMAEGLTDSTAYERAAVDMICAGNCCDYISSETVHFTWNPIREDIKRFTDHWSTELLVA